MPEAPGGELRAAARGQHVVAAPARRHVGPRGAGQGRQAPSRPGRAHALRAGAGDARARQSSCGVNHFDTRRSPLVRRRQAREFHAMRVGVIDVGSNTIRLLAADVGPNGLEVVHEHRVWARLGADVAQYGRDLGRAARSCHGRGGAAREGGAARGLLARGDARRVTGPPGGERRRARPGAGTRLGRSGARARPRRGGADSATRARSSRPARSTARWPSATWEAVRRSSRSVCPTAGRRGCGRSTSARCG